MPNNWRILSPKQKTNDQRKNIKLKETVCNLSKDNCVSQKQPSIKTIPLQTYQHTQDTLQYTHRTQNKTNKSKYNRMKIQHKQNHTHVSTQSKANQTKNLSQTCLSSFVFLSKSPRLPLLSSFALWPEFVFNLFFNLTIRSSLTLISSFRSFNSSFKLS